MLVTWDRNLEDIQSGIGLIRKAQDGQHIDIVCKNGTSVSGSVTITEGGYIALGGWLLSTLNEDKSFLAEDVQTFIVEIPEPDRAEGIDFFVTKPGKNEQGLIWVRDEEGWRSLGAMDLRFSSNELLDNMLAAPLLDSKGKPTKEAREWLNMK